MTIDTSRHPCFNAEARHAFGRVHLPVAPACNIQCNFCNRKYDCAQESRPGVSSAVLAPEQALAYLDQVVAADPRITVVGIAGPGDPFANADETMQTLRLVRARHPEMILCVASNGLGIEPHVGELRDLETSHVTLTINAVDPEIGARIVSWVRDDRRLYRGFAAAALLLARQLAALDALKSAGVTVKVNMILIPGINDEHVSEVARTVSAIGADVLNVVPVIPVADTPFAELSSPPAIKVAAARAAAAEFLPQMRHCTRCRADAVGLLGAPMPETTRQWLEQAARAPLRPADDRPFVAIASREGVLVNQHLGAAEDLWIFGPEADGYRLVERRATPPPGGGAERWRTLGQRLGDCRALLTSGAGPAPQRTLTATGLRVVVTETLIEEALLAVYEGQTIRAPVREFRCGAGCGGTGGGCG